MSGSVVDVTERWIRAGGRKIALGQRALVMGVLNITPDSFSDGGRFLDPRHALDRAQKMVEEGVDIIDVGAESSKPGSKGVDAGEELRRLRPILQILGKQCPVPISVDTRKAEVARKALDWGVNLINDISALRFSSDMGTVVAEFQAGIVLMHMQGDPDTMQDCCGYDNVVEEVKAFLRERINVAESYGISREQILIDPGIGFAKNIDQNLQLLNGLSSFKSLGQPLLVGVSHKSFIGSVLERPIPDRMMGTAAAVATSVLHGANIVRVHDVAQMRDVVTMTTAIKHAYLN
ncbi:MAG: dihydropteroate synthase [Nitrospirae bacterium]|nr:dihydropteroate synthase [Nitrospirota bacterium]MDA1302981.1 dihydropteroate synthase [Nitrospirota bacterium]